MKFIHEYNYLNYIQNAWNGRIICSVHIGMQVNIVLNVYQILCGWLLFTWHGFNKQEAIKCRRKSSPITITHSDKYVIAIKYPFEWQNLGTDTNWKWNKNRINKNKSNDEEKKGQSKRQNKYLRRPSDEPYLGNGVLFFRWNLAHFHYIH